MDVKDRWAVWPEAFGSDLEPGFQKMKDVLDGLTVYYQNPFIYDIRNTVLSFPDSNLDVALNKKQTACKKWLVDELYRAAGPRIKRIHVLAGWYGVLAAFLLNDPRFKIKKITSIDRDPSCQEIALSLNRTQVEKGRFDFKLADIHELDYKARKKNKKKLPHLIVNTSCEHLHDFAAWFATIPKGMTVALQSNNYFEIPEHVNSVNSLQQFVDQVPVAELLYSGQLELEKYTRFMVIGRK